MRISALLFEEAPDQLLETTTRLRSSAHSLQESDAFLQRWRSGNSLPPASKG